MTTKPQVTKPQAAKSKAAKPGASKPQATQPQVPERLPRRADKKPRGAGGGRGDLSAAEIVQTAANLALHHTFTDLSMRELAEALGVQPPAIYYHIPNRQALLDLTAESIMRGVPQPDAALPWQERLRQLILALRDTFLEYPGLGRYMLCTPSSIANAHWFQMHLKILHDAGFDGPATVRAMATLQCYANPVNMLGENDLAATQNFDPSAWHRLIATHPDEYRDLAGVMPLLPKVSFETLYEMGLSRVIAGLAADEPHG